VSSLVLSSVSSLAFIVLMSLVTLVIYNTRESHVMPSVICTGRKSENLALPVNVTGSLTVRHFVHCMLVPTDKFAQLSTTTLGQFQSGLKTILFRLAHGTSLGAFVTV